MSFTRIQARERVNAVEGGGDQIHVVTKNGFHKKTNAYAPTFTLTPSATIARNHQAMHADVVLRAEINHRKPRW